MRQPIGPLLEDSNVFFNWINGAACALIGLHGSLRTGLVDAIASEPKSIDQLADDVAIPAEHVARLVTFLAANRLADLLPGGYVVENAHTAQLRDAASCVECTVLGTVAGSHLDEALRQGKTAYEICFGQPVFAHLGSNPTLGATFNDFMGFMTRRQSGFVFENHSFKPFETIADIGGSQGDLLMAMLQHHPGARGILFDLPEVAVHAESRIAASPFADRIEIAIGSFFESVPSADLYTLKMILHDWNDKECESILRSIGAAINPGGRVAVMDQILPEVPTPGEALDMDIAMFIWDTGRERKLSEFESLFEASGFRLDRVTENPSGISVIEAVPA